MRERHNVERTGSCGMTNVARTDSCGMTKGFGSSKSVYRFPVTASIACTRLDRAFSCALNSV